MEYYRTSPVCTSIVFPTRFKSDRWAHTTFNACATSCHHSEKLNRERPMFIQTKTNHSSSFLHAKLVNSRLVDAKRRVVKTQTSYFGSPVNRLKTPNSNSNVPAPAAHVEFVSHGNTPDLRFTYAIKSAFLHSSQLSRSQNSTYSRQRHTRLSVKSR